MKIGYIGKRELKLAEKGKPFTVYPEETKSKNIVIYKRENLEDVLEKSIKVAQMTGIDKKLKINDIPMLRAYAETLFKLDRQ